MSKLGVETLHFVCLTIVVSLTVFLTVILQPCREKKIEVERIVRDTTTVIKIDTLVVTQVVEVENRVVDTMYIESNNGSFAPIPISQYRFFESGIYDIAATGFNVSLNSVTVFPKTQTEYITTTIEREVEHRTWDFYFGGGIWTSNGKVAPSIALTLKAPKKWIFSANFGIMGSKPVYGGTIQYNILSK